MPGKTEISILRDDLMILLDCLEVRMQDWSDTAKVLRGEKASRELFLIEECKGAEEADWIVQNFQKVYARVRDKALASQ